MHIDIPHPSNHHERPCTRRCCALFTVIHIPRVTRGYMLFMTIAANPDREEWSKGQRTMDLWTSPIQLPSKQGLKQGHDIMIVCLS